MRTEYFKKYYQKNKNKLRQRTSKYYHNAKGKVRTYRESDNYKKRKKKWEKKYYEKNKELIKLQRKNYRIKNRERYNALKRRYNKTPQRKQYMEVYHEEYYPKNLIKIKIYQRKYKTENRTRYNLYQQKRRIKNKSLIHNFTEVQWLAKLEATNGVCPECRNFVGITNLTLDHIPPISKAKEGFVYTIDDVRPLCKKCNSKFGNRWNNEY